MGWSISFDLTAVGPRDVVWGLVDGGLRMTRNMQPLSPVWLLTLPEGLKSCPSSATIGKDHRAELASMR